MKISETTSYPHPVLAPWSSDITGATISTALTFREEEEGRQVSIHCEATMDQPDLIKLLDEGAAAFGCFIKCQETGFRRLQAFGFPSGVHHFAPGALLGRVQLRPMIWAVAAIPGYDPEGAHAEFSGGSDIRSGEILALDDEQIIDVTRLPLASIESIFDIDSSDQLQDGEFEVDTEEDRITVRMSERTFELVQSLRQTDDITRIVVMNSLYVPVVMEILDQLRDGTEQFEQFRWLHPFRARCELLGVDLDNPDLLNDAQKLLAAPFASLGQLVDDTEEGDD